MGVWMMILIVSVGAPALGLFWWGGQRASRSAKARLDGDQFDADEMLIAFGATKEWV